MKKFQLKYSAPKTKVNSAGKVEQQNQKKPDRYCATCSTITDIISKEPQSEEKSYKLTGSALFNKMFSDIKKAHIPVCSFSVYDSDFTFCYGNVINNRAVLLNYYSNSTNPNQFCLEIILCRIRGAFDYLIYPYYPAYMG